MKIRLRIREISARGVLVLGLGRRSVSTTAFATAAPGFFAGTAPHPSDHRYHHQDHGEELLPFHAANITAKTKRATGIFGG
jgi:hypothetical protein